jgi:hypothetical protein
MQYDIQGDLIMTLKQIRLVTTDVAKLACFYGTASLERRSGSGPSAGAASLRDFVDTRLDFP